MRLMLLQIFSCFNWHG